MDKQPLLAVLPSPTTPPHAHRRHRALRRAEVVTVTSFADTPTAAPTDSAGKNVPIGPIVGGIVAGVVVVLLVGGIWWWCHHKAEKERKERQARLIAKASKSTGALSARPSLTPKDSGVAMHSMDKLSHTRQNRSAGNQSLFGALPAVPVVAYENKGREAESISTDAASRRHARPSTDPLSASTTSSNSSSGSSSSTTGDAASSSSRRHRHQRSLSKEPVPLAPPLAQTGIHRYQPARPSPLALAAKSATDDGSIAPRQAASPVTSPTTSTSRSREGSLSGSAVFGVKAGERRPDENVPKWGQKPFRSAAPAAAAAANTSNGNRTNDDDYQYSGSAPSRDPNGNIEQVTPPNEDSEDDDPFEHAKYDRHRSTASTQVSSVAGSYAGKRDTMRQSRDRDVMGGIAEWQEDVVARGVAPESGTRSHQRGPSYPYPPSQQAYVSQQYQDDGNAPPYTSDPFAEPQYEGDRYGNNGYQGSTRT